MPYPLKHVVNSFLHRDFTGGKASITPMKMQKLLYYLHGWHLAITDEPVITEEFQAWPYGPVEESLYHYLKEYGGKPITDYLKEWRGEDHCALMVAKKETTYQKIFDMVYRKYAPFNALQLSTMTHQTGTPWDITRRKKQNIIDNMLIKNHFKEIIHD